MKFSEDMIGKRVWDKETGDSGVITGQYNYSQRAVWVRWEDMFSNLWSCLDDLTFKAPINAEEITINGKRYKLVPIEEE